ncbi:REF/SRPP-like protein At3g05500 [Linum grandiflorum]
MAETNANPATPAPLAKDKAGPLKPRVETMEGTVKNVVGPVYDKYQDLPIGVLKFVDRKVDESVTTMDSHVPTVVKQVSSQALTAAQAAPGAARAVATEVQRSGVTGLAKNMYTKYEPKAKELYTAYEPKAEECAASAWRRLNQLPFFPQVAHVVVPTAAYWSEKYNDTVSSTAEKGYKVSSYLPLVPTKRIAKVFGGGSGDQVSVSN